MSNTRVLHQSVEFKLGLEKHGTNQRSDPMRPLDHRQRAGIRVIRNLVIESRAHRSQESKCEGFKR
jgi:hypothetical protein